MDGAALSFWVKSFIKSRMLLLWGIYAPPQTLGCSIESSRQLEMIGPVLGVPRPLHYEQYSDIRIWGDFMCSIISLLVCTEVAGLLVRRRDSAGKPLGEDLDRLLMHMLYCLVAAFISYGGYVRMGALLGLGGTLYFLLLYAWRSL